MSDRDKRKAHTPPLGVQEQIARAPTAEPNPELDELGVRLPFHPTPVDVQPITDAQAEAIMRRREAEHPIEALDRRSRETKNTSLTTLNLVDDLRKETKADLVLVHGAIAEQQKSINHVVKVVGDLSKSVGVQEGQNTIIIGMLKEQQETRRNTEHVVTTTRIAEVEVDKSRQLSQLEVDKNEKIAATEIRKVKTKVKWEWAGKIGLVVITAIAALVTAYMKCG